MTKPVIAVPSIGFKIESGNLYGYATSNGTTFYTVTLVTSYSVPSTSVEYEAILDPGVDVKYYVAGVLQGTLTTGVPSSGSSNVLYDCYTELGSTTYNARLRLTELKKAQG